MKPLIQKLVEIPSPSGYETRIRDLVRSEIEPYVDELRVDALGNLIARKGQSDSSALKVMLAAHIDEIGIIITHVDERGFLRFLPIGGVRPHTCVGGRVRFLNGQVGIISMERTEDPYKMPSFDQLFVDIGASRREQVVVELVERRALLASNEHAVSPGFGAQNSSTRPGRLRS